MHGPTPQRSQNIFLSIDSLKFLVERERIFIELMTSDRKLKASREGSK
jgi:hypothetical protein